MAEVLGSRSVTSRPVGWGDAEATHQLELADGRSVAVRQGSGQASGAGSRNRMERTAQVMRGLARAGLPVPIASTVHTPDASYLVTPWIEGETGAAWLGDPGRAGLARAGAMGELARQLRPRGAIGRLPGRRSGGEPRARPRVHGAPPPSSG